MVFFSHYFFLVRFFGFRVAAACVKDFDPTGYEPDDLSDLDDEDPAEILAELDKAPAAGLYSKVKKWLP